MKAQKIRKTRGASYEEREQYWTRVIERARSYPGGITEFCKVFKIRKNNYDYIYAGGCVREAACMAHARRRYWSQARRGRNFVEYNDSRNEVLLERKRNVDLTDREPKFVRRRD